MATIIDALIVELGLDASNFTASQKTAVRQLGDLEKAGEKTEKSTKKITKASKDAAIGINELSRTVASFLAIIGGTVAIKNWISDFIESGAAIDRLSKNLGLSVSTISAWSNATEKLGGSAGALQGTLDMLSKSQTQLMLTGESGLLPYMSALGISLADVHGKARPVDDILLDLADRFSRLDRTTANNLGRMMGLDQGTLNLLLQGRKELELEIQRQKEQTALTKEQTAQAQKFQTQIAGLKQQFQALGRSLFMEAVPYLEKMLEIFQNIANWAQSHQQFIVDFIKVIGAAIVGVSIAVAAANPELYAIAAAIGIVSAAIALLWDDYQTWKKGGDSLIDWGKWKPGVDAATWGIHQLNEEMKAFAKTAQFLHDLVPDWAAKAVQKGAAALGYRPAENELSGLGKSSRADRFLSGQRSAQPANDKVSMARSLAAQVSQKTGIPADLIFAQWAHETNDFTNRGATQLNNFAGINVPGGKGQDYKKFDSPDDFASYYAYLLRPGGRYAAARGAQTPEDFAAALKAGGYYGDSVSNYAAGIRRHLGSSYASSVAGIPGASSIVSNAPGGAAGSAPANIDRSVQTEIGTINIQTQATDADGIARDAYHSFDYLFTSQANTGLN